MENAANGSWKKTLYQRRNLDLNKDLAHKETLNKYKGRSL